MGRLVDANDDPVTNSSKLLQMSERTDGRTNEDNDVIQFVDQGSRKRKG